MPPIDEEPSHTSSSKRGGAKRKLVQDPENGSQHSNKRPRWYQTNKESQLAAYALECFVATPRLYVVGIAQRDSQIILSYFDATCVLKMASFDFVENPQYIALVLFGMLKCTPRDAGFNPFFHPGPAEEGEEGSTARRWKGSLFVFPGEKNGSDLSFTVEDKPWFIAPEVNGRMTCVIPVIDEQGQSLVIKAAYKDGARSLETNLVRKLLSKAPKLKKYLPDITWNRLYDSEKDLHLPRFKFALDVLSTFPVRHLLYFACKRYEKLWQVHSLEEFKAVFIDYVECHYWAYKEGKVLHRDISDNNLMVHRNGDTVIGILNDWDNASEVEEDGTVMSSKALQRTGTRPFMALDLLVTNTLPHLHRHDLESFLYILVWAGLHYNLKNGLRDTKDHQAVMNWDAQDLDRAHDAKNSFLTRWPYYQRVITGFNDEFRPLIPAWIDPLRQMFGRAVREKDDAEAKAMVFGQQDTYDNATCNGQITFEKFMAILHAQPRALSNEDSDSRQGSTLQRE
ncbi:hypothetical protein IW261DRAFT_1326532 [Armillaria novae-zelandiae]|uniref:Fungal-type protein kinase domain-containing protein n=1 Tax=Armillaria novae-zelandiae TaxID=153914 RepID=A0AA39TH53_9AGAR|nr:hypothetical protein IW261DRAFT_1326532 [Armillaria novae-zelandiae]